MQCNHMAGLGSGHARDWWRGCCGLGCQGIALPVFPQDRQSLGVMPPSFPGNCFRNYSRCTCGKTHRGFFGKLQIFRDSTNLLYAQSSFFFFSSRNIQFCNYSLKNELVFPCLSEKCISHPENVFSFTFWQFHCKAEQQQQALANRAWDCCLCYLSVPQTWVCFIPNEFVPWGKKGKKQWSCGSVLPEQCWSVVNAVCFLCSVRVGSVNFAGRDRPQGSSGCLHELTKFAPRSMQSWCMSVLVHGDASPSRSCGLQIVVEI